MEEAGKLGIKPRVRTFQDQKRHCGKAFLLEVVNEQTAKIKPFRHGGKIETVSLKDLRLWKGGNQDIPIEEIRKMASSSSVAVPAKGTHVDQDRMVVYSKKARGVWGGERLKWTQDFNQAIRWNQEELSAAKAVEARLKLIPFSNDAVLIQDAVAFGSLTELLDVLTSPRPQPIEKPSTPSVVDEEKPAKEVYNDDFIDFEALFNSNEEMLRVAEADRKKVGMECQKAKQALEELKRKFELLDRSVVALGGSSTLKGATAPKQRKGSGGKRLFLRSKIQNILKVCSRLNTDSIFDKIVLLVPDMDKARLSSALSAMKVDGLAERNENGWALTSEGRNANTKK